jgi:4-hydroxy-3-methylbut-2-enyl diphosphate reductase
VIDKDPRLIRAGFGPERKVNEILSRQYRSPLVERIRESDYRLELGEVTVLLAREFGFCYGVDRAVEYAYQARDEFPGKRLFLTGEIIHNPHVNEHLRALGIEFLDGSYGSTARFEQVTAEDVVLLPAFGVSVDMMDRLHACGAILVDTTCGSVLNVWKNVERYAELGFTAIIHGKHEHEETRATCSRITRDNQGHYLVVRDLAEARMVAGYLEGDVDRHSFLAHFAAAVSPGFDPERDLQWIGLANQTTMLSRESLEIVELLRRAMAHRYGADALDERFRTLDTICSATQDRQDAVIELVGMSLDLMLVVGGFRSSNTTHLAEIASASCPTFHVEDAASLLDVRRIRHQPLGGAEPEVAEDWLPERRPLVIGLTAGASTPESEVGATIERIAQLLDLPGVGEGEE